jgi:high-affinity K+ transport system ATPase subunit B
MKRAICTILLLTAFGITPAALAGNKTAELVLWGEQTAGSGHAVNAKTDGNTLVLTATATITSVDGNAKSYCIWTIVTPKHRQAHSVLCGGEGKESLIGKTLPAGSYRVLPGLDGQHSARVTIQFK